MFGQFCVFDNLDQMINDFKDIKYPNRYKSENLTRPMSVIRFEFIIKNLPTKTQGWENLICKFLQEFKKEIIAPLCKFLQIIMGKGRLSKFLNTA